LVSLAELHQDIRRSIEVADIRRSRRLCESILSARPDNLETLLLLAEVDLESGNQEAAVDGFARVLKGDPEAYLAYAGIAIAYEATHDSETAVRYFSRALDLDPANAGIRQERDRICANDFPDRPIPTTLTACGTARSFLEAGFYPRAVEAHRTALALEPDRVETRLGLAESLWMLGGTKEPQDLCEEVLRQAPRAVKAQALIACVTAETEDLNRGLALLDDVHAQDPDGRVAGYIVAQTPLADWAVVSVDLSLVEQATDDVAVELQDLPTWTLWMRQALWQVLRLVRPVGYAGPDWSILETVDPEIRNRTSPYGPLGRRIRAVGPPTMTQPGMTQAGGPGGALASGATALSAQPGAGAPQDDEDTTQIIMRQWPSPKRGPAQERNTNE
jgi:tetratricopeptide (TPR) repeat protein